MFDKKLSLLRYQVVQVLVHQYLFIYLFFKFLKLHFGWFILLKIMFWFFSSVSFVQFIPAAPWKGIIMVWRTNFEKSCNPVRIGVCAFVCRPTTYGRWAEHACSISWASWWCSESLSWILYQNYKKKEPSDLDKSKK